MRRSKKVIQPLHPAFTPAETLTMTGKPPAWIGGIWGHVMTMLIADHGKAGPLHRGGVETLCPSVAFLAAPWQIDAVLIEASRLARHNGTTAAEEMMAAGQLDEHDYARALARAGGLDHVTASDVKQCLFRGSHPERALRANRMIDARLTDDRFRLLIAPEPRNAAAVIALARREQVRRRVAVIAPSALRQAILSDAADDVCAKASEALAQDQPRASARHGPDFRQGVLLSLFTMAVIYAYAGAPSTVALVLHLTLSLFFLAGVVTRLGAAMSSRRLAHMHSPAPISDTARDDSAKPVYSVMVTLLHEAAVVPGLIHHLKALRWPDAKLDIKLVCEADDAETLSALAREHLDSRFEVIHVPPVGPRTKPKALAYALPFTRGSLVTLYDAEDRPHPEQLEEAWSVFSASGPDLACLQAPLVIANAGHNMLTALFHLEYAGLFRRLLPFLARYDHALPLGGTSNHFRRAALEAVGGWDPYNVTEDADLGLRLWRRGYRSATITRPTLEDAPDQFVPWLKQRTRWFKGWMQTWVVHSRRPGEMIARRGLFGFFVAHVILTGVIVSSLLHPLMLVNAALLTSWLVLDARPDSTMLLIAWIDWFAVITSYLAFGVMGWTGTRTADKLRVGWRLAAIPLYWMLMSLAAWRGLHQIFVRPFLWEKTPHKPYRYSARDCDTHHDRPDRPGRKPRQNSRTARPAWTPESVSGRSAF